MNFIASVVILASASAAAPAASVYLECTAVSQTGHTRHLQIGLNEGQGTAQYTVVETGFTETRPAMFTPTSVTWAMMTAGFRQHMIVDRSTLQFSSSMDGIDDAGEQGQCLMPKTDPNRQF